MKTIKIDEPQKHFEYKDSKLYWKYKRGASVKESMEAGCIDSHGYLVVTFDKKSYKVHRIIYAMHTNEWPNYIDHIDGNRLNNNISNLRNADQYQNGENRKKGVNNTSGVKGVDWNKRVGKWRAMCSSKGKRYFLGYFDDIENAKSIIYQFRLENHKEYAKNG